MVFSRLLGISKKQRDAIVALAEWEDIRAVGPLVEFLNYEDRDIATGKRNAGSKRDYRVGQHGYIYEKIRASLIKLLPTLQASDADLLSSYQRGILYRELNGKDIELSLAILKALQQVGDRNALPVVDKLARGDGRSAKSIELQQAAQMCLPFLMARTRGEQEQHQLLRAFGSNASTPDTLLRPATGDGQADSQELLRADLSESSVQNLQDM
jgi:hypothetical protein